MPILFFILLVVLIVQVGFAKPLGAFPGEVVMMVQFVILGIAVVVVGLLAFARVFFR